MEICGAEWTKYQKRLIIYCSLIKWLLNIHYLSEAYNVKFSCRLSQRSDESTQGVWKIFITSYDIMPSNVINMQTKASRKCMELNQYF